MMLLADAYSNFKSKANERFTELWKVIKKQMENEKQLNIQRGMTPYMATLISTSTIGD